MRSPSASTGVKGSRYQRNLFGISLFIDGSNTVRFTNFCDTIRKYFFAIELPCTCTQKILVPSAALKIKFFENIYRSNWRINPCNDRNVNVAIFIDINPYPF